MSMKGRCEEEVKTSEFNRPSHNKQERESNVMIKILYNVKNTTFQTTLIIKTDVSHREQPAGVVSMYHT